MIDPMTRRMIVEFGADCLISKRPWEPSPPMIAEIRRRHTHRMNDWGKFDRFVFPEDGATPLVTVVWDSPRHKNHESRVIVRRILTTHHIDNADVAQVWATREKRDTPPLPADIAAARIGTMEGIIAANCQHVILLGGAVTSLWWGKAKITRVSGNGYIWDVMGRTFHVFPMYHPLALKYDLDMEAYSRMFSRVAWAIREESVLRTLDTLCHGHNCKNLGMVYDERGVAWCDSHFQLSEARNEVKKWNKMAARLDQETLAL